MVRVFCVARVRGADVQQHVAPRLKLRPQLQADVRPLVGDARPAVGDRSPFALKEHAPVRLHHVADKHLARPSRRHSAVRTKRDTTVTVAADSCYMATMGLEM